MCWMDRVAECLWCGFKPAWTSLADDYGQCNCFTLTCQFSKITWNNCLFWALKFQPIIKTSLVEGQRWTWLHHRVCTCVVSSQGLSWGSGVQKCCWGFAQEMYLRCLGVTCLCVIFLYLFVCLFVCCHIPLKWDSWSLKMQQDILLSTLWRGYEVCSFPREAESR